MTCDDSHLRSEWAQKALNMFISLLFFKRPSNKLQAPFHHAVLVWVVRIPFGTDPEWCSQVPKPDSRGSLSWERSGLRQHQRRAAAAPFRPRHGWAAGHHSSALSEHNRAPLTRSPTRWDDVGRWDAVGRNGRLDSIRLEVSRYWRCWTGDES